MKKCNHKVVNANPITGDPLILKLICINCGKTTFDESRIKLVK